MDLPQAVMSWSGGKDCLSALELAVERFQLVELLTVCSGEDRRVSMHGVPLELIHLQAQSLGLDLHHIELPPFPPNEIYDRAMADYLSSRRRRGIDTVVFGDIFLRDLRDYREERMNSVGMRAAFPLWEHDTRKLVKQFIQRGNRAVLVCVDGRVLDSSFLGRELDEDLLRDLPEGCDPCGENGEFHTFVFDGPLFKQSVAFVSGGITAAHGHFHYLDIQPRSNPLNASR